VKQRDTHHAPSNFDPDRVVFSFGTSFLPRENAVKGAGKQSKKLSSVFGSERALLLAGG
jgi:hypothetical protein